MQKIIRKNVCDTETATKIAGYVSGTYGDPAGYEEILFQAPEGHYFVYGIGGETSPYPEETIATLAKTKVKAWIAERA